MPHVPNPRVLARAVGAGFRPRQWVPRDHLVPLLLLSVSEVWGTPGPAQSLSLTRKAILVVVKFTYFSV